MIYRFANQQNRSRSVVVMKAVNQEDFQDRRFQQSTVGEHEPGHWSPDPIAHAQHVPQDASPSGKQHFRPVYLTDRERAVMNLVIQGYTDLEIASALDVSFHTVKVHVRNVRIKVNAPNRSAAVARVIRGGLI